MKLFILIVITFITALASAQKRPTGFYLTVDCAKKSQSETALVTGKTSCITNKPILKIEDFESISGLMEISPLHMVFFDLVISAKGFKMLQQLESVMSKNNFALVVDDRLIFVIDKANTDLHSRAFRVIGTLRNNAISNVHKKLSAQIANKQPSVLAE